VQHILRVDFTIMGPVDPYFHSSKSRGSKQNDKVSLEKSQKSTRGRREMILSLMYRLSVAAYRPGVS